MEAKLISSNLAKAISVASRYVSTVGSDFSTCIYIRATGSVLEIMATDLQQVCKISVSCEVVEEGDVLLPAKQLKSFVLDEDVLTIKTGRARCMFYYPTHVFRVNIVAEEPMFPECSVDGEPIRMPVSAFDPAKTTVHIGGRPALECVYIMPNGDILAGDGFVASKIMTNIDVGGLLPIRSDFLFKALSAVGGDDVLITLGNRIGVSAIDGNATVVFPLSGMTNAPPFNELFSGECEDHAVLSGEALSVLRTICKHTADVDAGAIVSLRIEEPLAFINVHGYADSSDLFASGSMRELSNYSRIFMKVIQHLDLGSGVAIDAKIMEGEGIVRHAFLHQGNMSFFLCGARV